MTSRVRVYAGTTSFDFPHAVADVFEAGVLLIHHPQTEQFLAAFDPEDWISVTVFGEDGYPLYGFDNDTLRMQVPHHPHPLSGVATV